MHVDKFSVCFYGLYIWLLVFYEIVYTGLFEGMWTSISAFTLSVFKMGCEKGIKNAENRRLSAFSVNSICYDDYSATLNSLMVPVSEENTVPTLKSLRPSAS